MSGPCSPPLLAPSLGEGNLTRRLLSPSELMEKRIKQILFLSVFARQFQRRAAADARGFATAPLPQGRGHRWDVGMLSQRMKTSLYSQDRAARVLLALLYSVQIGAPRPWQSPLAHCTPTKCSSRAGGRLGCSFEHPQPKFLPRSPVPLSHLGLRPKLCAEAVCSGTEAPGGRWEPSGSVSVHGAAQRALKKGLNN